MTTNNEDQEPRIRSDKFKQLQNDLKNLYMSAMMSTKHCYETLFAEGGSDHPEIVLPLLNDAASTVNAMHAIYITFYDDLARQEFDEFFHRFDTFKDEVFTNFREDHSHQYSSIYYNEMIDWAIDLGGILTIGDPSFLKANTD